MPQPISLVLIGLLPLTALAQTKPTTKPTAKPVSKVTPKVAAPSTKPNPGADAARQALIATLNAVNDGWFGKSYQDVNAVDLKGTLAIELSARSLNAKVDQLSQGQVKGGITKDGKADLTLQGTYFANGDFKTEMGGAFGSLLYTRVGNRGFLFSRTQNAYTTRVSPPPTDAPLTYLGWFRSVLNDIQAVYADGQSFKASQGKEVIEGGRTLTNLIFEAPTSAYDSKKREQSLDESLGFWKRGRMELLVDKANLLPVRMNFTNEAQGIRSQMDFRYDGQNRLLSVNTTNHSRGMEGPGFLQVVYGGDGRMSQIQGELSSSGKKVAFNLGLTWVKGRKTSSILSVPPPGATKKSREELEVSLLASLAGNLLELQRAGLNLRSVTLGAK